ncbi:MAG: S8 family serine peptidase [Verrucomicrobiales bacterium]|nr:S8 family serine peptidase [Verrucomicrobiales bacterium]
MQSKSGTKAILCAVLVLAVGLSIFLFHWNANQPTSGDVAPSQLSPAAVSPAERESMPSVSSPENASGVELLTDATLEDSGNALAKAFRDLLEKPGIVPGELLLKFRYASDIAALRSRAGSLGLSVLWSDSRVTAARIAYTDPEALAEELQSNGDAYEDFGPNFEMRIPGLPPEPELDSNNPGGTVPFRETLMESIGADRNRSQWGSEVTVAILDSGILDHPSLANVGITRMDLSSSGEIHGHGTAMASLVAGQLYPAEGIAPAASLLDLRVTDGNGVTNTGLVAQGILAAADQRVDVINISLGSFGDSSVLRAAIEYALERNIIVIAAAGNEQTTRLAFPAAYGGVISVGAVDAENTQAYFSNSGETLSISAPGVGIFSAYEGGKLVLGSGTSQATAITSGVVAALLSQGYRPGEIPGILQKHAYRTGAPREQVGAGVIQVP